MDPFTVVAARIAGSIAGSAAKLLGGTIRDVVLGSKEQKAVEKAVLAAIERAVAEASGQGLSPQVAAHIVSLFERLFLEQVRSDSGAVGRHDPESAIRYLRQDAEATGWDLETLPVEFPKVVGCIIEYIPEELRREARRPESPLYNRVTVEALSALQYQLASVLR